MLGGRISFFNPKNLLKLELSSKVIRTEPKFESSKLEDGLEDS